MDFDLSEDLRILQKTVRDFAATEIAPVAATLERESRFPREILKKLAGIGILGMVIPEEYGGAGFGAISSSIVLEEIAAACASTAVTVSVHNTASAGPITRFGTAAQKKRYLPPMARGDYLGGFALTEPSAGSDAASIRTRAVRRGDRYILNGAKSWITNVHEGGVYVLMASTDPARGARGVTAFLVEPAFPGFAFGKDEDKMGLRASLTGEIALTDCEVPAENVLGEEGMGLRIALATLDSGRIGIAAQAIGIARAAFEAALSHARTREAFGGPLAKLQAIQNKLADMALQIDAARLLTQRAAWLAESGAKNFTREASEAKLYATEMGNRVCYEALQIFGGYGYSKEYPVERLARDVRVTTLYEGTSEIQRLVIARQLVGAA
ncbi:MAG: acyl-CoA dehydrogenase family protein [Acidobacteria bacterium]|nr:acyl-CoA dehydrogenase family protein [Acidobacteriota bacterium]